MQNFEQKRNVSKATRSLTFMTLAHSFTWFRESPSLILDIIFSQIRNEAILRHDKVEIPSLKRGREKKKTATFLFIQHLESCNTRNCIHQSLFMSIYPFVCIEILWTKYIYLHQINHVSTADKKNLSLTRTHTYPRHRYDILNYLFFPCTA